ncbi:MAG: hypothetical protein IAF38_21645 [Bacteroidia bacterium]|nr:hypothetical protein [Bacteroidia bacterium]
MGNSQKKFLFISISLVLYLAALVLPSYHYHHLKDGYGNGLECLAMGFCTTDFIKQSNNPFPFISWISNLPFVIGLIILIFSKKQKGFSNSFYFLFFSFIMSLGSLINYSNPAYYSFSPGIGCYVWIFSQVLLCAGAYSLKRQEKEVLTELIA